LKTKALLFGIDKDNERSFAQKLSLPANVGCPVGFIHPLP
jgi:hypothetical protein